MMMALAGLLLAFALASARRGAIELEVAAWHLVALAEAAPADKFSFRLVPGVRPPWSKGRGTER